MDPRPFQQRLKKCSRLMKEAGLDSSLLKAGQHVLSHGYCVIHMDPADPSDAKESKTWQTK